MTLKKVIPYIAFLFMCGIFSGCIDEIDLEEEAEFIEKLVIDGQLRRGNPSTIRVQVSNSINYQSRPVTSFVSGGRLTLIDDGGNRRAIPEVEEGRYVDEIGATDPFVIATGRAYKIQFELGANTYESRLDTLYPVPQADSLSFGWKERQVLNEQENIIDEFLWQLFIHTPLSQSPNSSRTALRWDFSSIWSLVETPPPTPRFARTCYVSEDINLDKVVVFSPSETDRSRLDGLFLTENLLSHKFANGQRITALQQSMSHTAYVYWDRVSQVIARSGGFLETPPGKISGNMFQVDNPDAEVLGLFYASDVDTVRVFMQSADFPTQLFGFCWDYPDVDDIDTPEPCRDCLAWPNSTYERPSIWFP